MTGSIPTATQSPQTDKPRSKTSETSDPHPPRGLTPSLVQAIRRRQTAMFSALLRACADGHVAAIHDVRVASRRLSEPLALLAEDLPRGEASKMRRAVRRLRRTFQAVRDIDVICGHLAEARQPAGGRDVSPRDGDTSPALDQALARVTAALTEQRQRQMATAIATAYDRRTFRLQMRLDHLCSTVAGVEGAPPAAKVVPPDAHGRAQRPFDDKRLAQRLSRLVAERASALMAGVYTAPPSDVAGSHGSDGSGPQFSDDPHAVRIAVKRLRYALELADALGRPVGSPDLLSLLRQAQEALGDWHDHVVLAEELARHCFADQAIIQSPPLSTALLAHSGERLRHSAGYLDTFRAIWPKLRAVLETIPQA